MAIIDTCCCWQSLRRGAYASAAYTSIYFSLIIVTMGHFINNEYLYLSGQMEHPQSESYLEPELITHVTVALNIALLVASILGLLASGIMAIGVYKDSKYLLLPWLVIMVVETILEVVNVVYLIYLQTVSPKLEFNPITSFLFTMDFFVIGANIYAMVCVASLFQKYLAGGGTAACERHDRMAVVQYTATGGHTATTSSAPSGRRRSAGRPMPSRCEIEEISEVPSRPIRVAEGGVPTVTVVRPGRSTGRKHVQFPDEQSCVEREDEALSTVEVERPEGRVISSLWMELESTEPPPER